VLRPATCYYQFNHSKVEAISLSTLTRTQQAILPAYLRTNPFVLNVKHGSCEYQLLKSLGWKRGQEG